MTALLLLNYLPGYAQLNQGSTQKITSAIKAFSSAMPTEKVYLHIDRPYYSTTDTIWIKAYVLNGDLEASRQSGLLYTELINQAGSILQRQCMPVFMGISYGQIQLDSTTVNEGAYTLRAYTNWMQNQGDESFFQREIYIANSEQNPGLIKALNTVKQQDEKYINETGLQFIDTDGSPARLKDITITLMQNEKSLFKKKLQTDLEGRLNFNFNIPENTGGNRLNLKVQNNGQTLFVPVKLNRAEKIEVQFMPEGGSLVAGLTSKVGFKAIGEDGNGADVNGSVHDENGSVAAAFKTNYKGMGSFTFSPLKGHVYTATVILPGGILKAYSLPVVKPSGVVLGVNNIPGRDSIIITIQATNDVVLAQTGFSLTALNRNSVCYASAVKFKNSNTIRGAIPKSKFPGGVCRFTLFNNQQQPLAERIIFIPANNELIINAAPDKTVYHPADSVVMHIKVSDKDSLPVQGSFSLSVTDDSQVKTDSANVNDISSYMLLQSELKGIIEEPGYYLNNSTAATATVLDDLMLTQGWVAYKWGQVFAERKAPEFKAEPEIAVSGVVKRLNKPQPGIRVSLLSMNPLITKDTLTDNKGRFNFTGFPRIDSPSFAIRVKDKKGKMFEAIAETDEFMPAGIQNIQVPDISPWYVNTNAVQLNFSRQNAALQKDLDMLKFGYKGKLLKEVQITGNKIIKNSKNLNGSGNADQVLNEETIVKAGKMPLFDLLVKKIKGFGTKMLPVIPPSPEIKYYAVYDKQVKFVIDGVNLDTFFQPVNPDRFRDMEHFYFLTSYLDMFTAEDIKGVEILYRNGYTSKYKTAYDSESYVDPICLYCAPPRYKELAYVEITTWSGNGPSQHRKRNMTVYRPMPVNWPKDFYKPKYVNAKSTLLNLQPTIHWEPNIVTDKNGNATLSFFTKSKPGNYTLILQGADLDGRVASKTLKLQVK
ncbi:MAG: hypothetical protein EOP46_08825 [Sphingobacteriaceae bacterium]|nr:MAG: hypothetical protein EOP46_08825 [Sphingobacteriaceae bacterium]